MERELAKAIVEAADWADVHGIELYEDYSGRGMYGAKTTAVKAESISDLITALISGAEAFFELGIENVFEDLTHDFKTDSLGTGIVVY